MSVQVDDFSGGMTDNLTSGNASQGDIVENLNITRDRKLETREGSEVYDSAASYEGVVRSVSEKVGNLHSFLNNKYLLIRKSADVFFKRTDNGVWQKVVSPNATQKSFWTTTADSVCSFKEFSNQTYAIALNDVSAPAANDYLSPMRFFDNSDGLVNVRNMSPPEVPNPYSAAVWLPDAITLGNEIRTKLIAHFAVDSLACTFTAATDRVSATNLGSLFSTSDTYDQNIIWFSSRSGPTTLSINRGYFLVNQSGDSFQLSNTPGGSAIDIDVDGTGTIGFHETNTPTSGIAAAATDLPTLIQLTNTLVYYYNLHLLNAYLAGNPHNFSGGSYTIPNDSIGSFLSCARTLNRLKFLFNLHLMSYSDLNVSVKQHSFVSSSEFITSAFIFTQGLTTPDISRSVAGTSGGTARYEYVIPTSLKDLIDNTVTSYNRHVSDTDLNQHTTEDYFNRVKRNQAALADPNNLDTVDYFSAYTKTVAAFYRHRSRGLDPYTVSTVHGGSETSDSALTSQTLKSFTIFQTIGGGPNEGGDGQFFTDTTLIDSGTFNSIYAALRDVTTKLFKHGLQGTTRHLVSSAAPYQVNTITTTYYGIGYRLTYVTRNQLLNDISVEQENAPIEIGCIKEVFADGTYDVSGNYTPGTFVISDLIAKSQVDALSIVGSENISTTETVLRLYRTINDGTVYYLVGEGLPALIDESTTDDELQDHLGLYTNGGVVANDPAPKAKCLEIINNKAYFGNIIETQDNGTDVILPRRLRQSKDSEVYACPESFFVDMESDIETIGRAGEYPIVVCTKGVYRVQGEFADDGTGGMIASKISDRVGGVSSNGGVTVKGTFYFAGHDGFYRTDGFDVVALAPHLKDTYAQYVNGDRKHYIQCKFDRANNKVLWNVRAASGGTESELDTVVQLDLSHGSDAEGSFVEWNGTSFCPTAIEVHNDVLTRGDKQGFTFKHNTSLYNDPAIVRTGSGSISGVEAIIPRYRSVADSTGSSTTRKWLARFFMIFEKLTTNLTAQPRSVIDLTEGKIENMKYVIERSTTYPSGYQGSDICAVKRTIPAKHTRAYYRQLEIALGKKTDDSSTVVLATVSGTTVTKTGSWPADCDGKWISFSSDYYVREFLIVSGQGTSSLTLSTAPGDASSLSWGIRSYPTNERMRILSLGADPESAGRTLQPSAGSDGTSA